jgi:hypothetical protein
MKKPTLNIINKKSKEEFSRGYLGASEIGESCHRKIWYNYRWWAPQVFDPRIKDIFLLGHAIEELVLAKFKNDNPNFKVYDKKPDGRQFRFTKMGGAFAGSLDAIIKGFVEFPDTPVVVDVKSFKESRFKNWQRKGVKQSDPKYYTQLNMYAGAFKLEKCAIIGYNKNTSEIDYELFDADPDHFQEKLDLAKEILEANTPPDRAWANPAYFECKWCNFSENCWYGLGPSVNCRTCKSYRVDLETGWGRCNINNAQLTFDKQSQGCELHETIV